MVAHQIEMLQNERDFEIYLDILSSIMDRFFVAFVVKGTSGSTNRTVKKKIRCMGFNNISDKNGIMYIGLANNNQVICDLRGAKAKESVSYQGEIEDEYIFINSSTSCATINIGNSDYSSIFKGINIIVYCFKENRVIDRCYYNPTVDKPDFFHLQDRWIDTVLDNQMYISSMYMDSWERAFRKKYFSNKSLGFKEIENGIIEPIKKSKGGVTDSEFKFVAGHFKHRRTGTRSINASYRVNDDSITMVDEEVIFGGILFDHPGHQIVETFPTRLWYLNKYQSESRRIAIIAKSMWGRNYNNVFIYEFLELIGIDSSRIIIVDKPMRFKKVIVPESSLVTTSSANPYAYTRECKELYDSIRLKNTNTEERKKIYLTKKKTSIDNVIGEDWFINYYKEKGFHIVCPEDYSTEQKVKMMCGAEEVVSLIGTNALWTVFCESDVKVTLLTRTKEIQNMKSVALVLEIAEITDISIVDVSGRFLDNHFTYGITLMYVTDEFKKYAKLRFDDDIRISPEESLKSVIWDYLSYYPEYFEQRPIPFNQIKNQKMIEILQRMSVIFNGRDFDTQGLDLVTSEDEANKKLEISERIIDFQRLLFEDYLKDKKIYKYFIENKFYLVGIICEDERVLKIIRQLLSTMNVNVVADAVVVKTNKIPDNQWCCFKQAQIVLYYNYKNKNPGTRDDVKPISFLDILNSNNDVIDTLPRLYSKKLALEYEFADIKYKYESELFQIQYEIDSLKNPIDGRTN